MSSSTSNSEPLLLVRRAAWAGAIVACILIAAFFNGHHASWVDYHGATSAKLERLMSLPSPKVVVVGGSNMTFGVDSEELEKALCMPVVNMSIHASLGIEYMVNEVKDHLGKGDLVIAGFEGASLNVASKDNEVHVLTVDRAPAALAAIPWYRRPRILINVAIMRLQAAWKYATGEWGDEEPEPVYTARGFNERGDMVAHLGLPQRPPELQERVVYPTPLIGDEVIPMLKDLVANAERKGAKVVFVWSCVASSSRRPDLELEIEQRMRQAGIPLLGEAAAVVFPDTSFHDTHYHLRATGRKLRTQRLIEELCTDGEVHCCSTPSGAPEVVTRP